MRVLIVGLGNMPLKGTRHSVGQMIVDSLADRLGIRMSPDKNLDGVRAQTEMEIIGRSVHISLFKSYALMNVSGKSIALACRQTVSNPSFMIVIHDALDYEPGKISPKFGGSANGHKGVQSVISALGGDKNFHRLRIGIGRQGDAKDFVLGSLSSFEKGLWKLNGAGIDLIWKDIEDRIRLMMTSTS